MQKLLRWCLGAVIATIILFLAYFRQEIRFTLFENTTFPQKPLYQRIEGDTEISSGSFIFTGERWEAIALLQIPVNKRNTLYLSGNGESQAFLIVPDTNLNLQQHSLANTLEDEIIQTFHQVKTDSRWYKIFHFAGSRGEGGHTIFPLPTNFPPSTEISILIMIISGEGKETFREVSNKETYRINERGAVMKYLSGSEEYGGSYEGVDPFGEVVPFHTTVPTK